VEHALLCSSIGMADEVRMQRIDPGPRVCYYIDLTIRISEGPTTPSDKFAEHRIADA
jgi:hypothetical protein